ncbi:thioredoxin domain-containing protein [Mucilaginibacter sp. JRF]|nr:thioredoxin domain-containing protein [Mucilaginibacter sp. JRF]
MIAYDIEELINEFDKNEKTTLLSKDEIRKVGNAKATVAAFKAIKCGIAVDGPYDANVTIIMFGDYQCPYSARANEIFELIRSRYRGQIRFSFRNYPLPFHNHALSAAKATIAASRQGKFWDFHHELFKLNTSLDNNTIDKIAIKLNLNIDWFRRDIKDPEIAQLIANDIADATRLNVKSTPTLFISNTEITGCNNEQIDSVLSQLLAKR